MERDEHQIALTDWLTKGGAPLFTHRQLGDISNALYTYSEVGLFDGLSIDEDLAIRIWALIEKVRKDGFPSELRV